SDHPCLTVLRTARSGCARWWQWARGRTARPERRRGLLRLSEGLDGVVPEDLAHQIGLYFLPAQRQVDGAGEPCLGVRIVRAEHEKVFAEVLKTSLTILPPSCRTIEAKKRPPTVYSSMVCCSRSATNPM